MVGGFFQRVDRQECQFQTGDLSWCHRLPAFEVTEVTIVCTRRLVSCLVHIVHCGIENETTLWNHLSDACRAVGYEALGFSYMPKTPVLLHDHNEFLHEDVFLKGIDVFEEVVQRMANVD